MIEGAVKSAENGVRVSQRVAEALRETVDSAGKVSRLVDEIASAGEEQAQGIEQINMAVSQMDQVTQQNAASAEESAAASEELSAQALQMNHMVRELMALVGGAGVPRHSKAGAAAGKSGASRSRAARHGTAPPAHAEGKTGSLPLLDDADGQDF
jgi:methyl-accepting chemotaxis protein